MLVYTSLGEPDRQPASQGRMVFLVFFVFNNSEAVFGGVFVSFTRVLQGLGIFERRVSQRLLH